MTLQTRGHKRLNWLAQYVLSRTTDDTGGLFSLPADNYDLRPERGRADYDQRHRFTLLGTYSSFWGLTLGAIGLTTGVMPSMTLGSGGVGGAITGDNITAYHLINIKRLAYELTPPPMEAFLPGEAPTGASPIDIEKIVRQVVNEILESKQFS